MLSLKINGRNYDVDAEPDTPLLWVLRDTIGLTGTKFGCGAALCGCCTVHVAGEAVRSCSIPAAAVVGKDVTTGCFGSLTTPSMVVMSLPTKEAAGIEQERTASPAT